MDLWRRIGPSFFLLLISPSAAWGADDPVVAFAHDRARGRLEILVGDEHLATFAYRDPTIRRPYFEDLRVPGGIPVTRPNPPGPSDPGDHPTMHPGLWMGFGDLGGADFWRNKGNVVHRSFVEEPHGSRGRGQFAVAQEYRSPEGKIVAREIARFSILASPKRTLLAWDSTIAADDVEFAFGDQEEMGLGLRLATALAPKAGQGGRLQDAHGHRGEAGIRGKSAPWCAGVGTIAGRPVAVTIMADPSNFRPAWWHARDYGLIVANPFGRSALTGGKPDRTLVKPGEPMRLRFGVGLESAEPGVTIDPAEGYRAFLAAGAVTGN